jgi:Predicted membrane protein involved in D-alanine export
LRKRSSSRTICGPSSTRSSARTSRDFPCSAHGTPSSCIRCMFTLTSAVIPILPSASVACLASTLTKTSVIRLPAPPLQSSGSAGTSPSAPSSATTFCTCRSSASRASISACSLFGSAPVFGTVPHGTSFYGAFTTAASCCSSRKWAKRRMKKWPIVWKHVYTKLVIILGFGIFYF